ncbi:hypothetical protein PENSPDRAFT_403155 [Peniophora sp. CONT]|nr:hypothetical protein PENSPDRAFT_403155 [Peniophora sp. CONT]
MSTPAPAPASEPVPTTTAPTTTSPAPITTPPISVTTTPIPTPTTLASVATSPTLTSMTLAPASTFAESAPAITTATTSSAPATTSAAPVPAIVSAPTPAIAPMPTPAIVSASTPAITSPVQTSLTEKPAEVDPATETTAQTSASPASMVGTKKRKRASAVINGANSADRPKRQRRGDKTDVPPETIVSETPRARRGTRRDVQDSRTAVTMGGKKGLDLKWKVALTGRGTRGKRITATVSSTFDNCEDCRLMTLTGAKAVGPQSFRGGISRVRRSSE